MIKINRFQTIGLDWIRVFFASREDEHPSRRNVSLKAIIKAERGLGST